MKLRLLAVLSAAVFFYSVFFFHPPMFLSIGILLPFILLTAYLVTVYYNAAVSGNFNPVLPDRDGDRLSRLNSDMTLMQSLHFQKIDSFLVPTIPESLTLVFLHPSESILAVVRQAEHKKTWEFITFFDGSDLTTGSDAGSGNRPRSVRHPLQIFLNSDPVSLLNGHREAVHFLVTRGSRPRNLPASAVRKALLIREKELLSDLRALPFWPLGLLLRTVRKEGGRLTVPVEDRPEWKGIPPIGASGPSVPAAAALQNPRYRVVFRGAVREGFTVTEVKDNLSRKFRLDASKTDTLFSGNPVLIRSDADEASARKVREAFYREGAACLIEIQPAAVIRPDPAAARTSAPAETGGRPETDEEGELRKFQIQSLLMADRTASEREFKAFETPEWTAYALALSSFIPVIGIAAGPVSIAYGLSKRRTGGVKIAVIGFMGLIFTLMGGVGDLFVKVKQRAAVTQSRPLLQTKRRLDDLVRCLETYRERNGRYPESLTSLQAQPDAAITILDPMDPRPPDENRRELAYEPDSAGRSYRLYSAGADGIPGTADDVFPDLPPEELAGTGYRP
jgi:hypothetical protein